MTDDFEIIPEREISDLKKEIKKVKENPFGDNESSGRFLKTVDSLNDSMSNMLNLFKIAADSMQNEEKEEVFLAEKIKPLSEKVDKLLDQNEKIAKALVAIADMIEEIKTQKKNNPLDDLRMPEKTNQQFSPNPYGASQFQSQGFGQNSQPSFGGMTGTPRFSSSPGMIPPVHNTQSFNQGLNQNNDFSKDMKIMPSMSQESQFGSQNQQGFPSGAPSPFLEDDFSSSGQQSGSGLPPFSDFSGDHKMSMPPPPKDMFGDLGSGPQGFNPTGNHMDQPKKKGLFGKR